MKNLKKVGLLPRLILGILLGTLIGSTGLAFLTRLLLTFSGVFGNFLGYSIPLLIIGFIVPGIAELGGKAGKLLGITAGIAYLSTIIAGVFAYLVSTSILPNIVATGEEITVNDTPLSPFFVIEIPPIMGVMTALMTAFLLGLGISVTKGKNLLTVMQEFQCIIIKLIEYVIIPFLPIHIAGIFAEMAYSDEILETVSVFGSIFILVIIVHILYILFQYFISSLIVKNNPFAAIKKMAPAYFTAIGTQSSAATIPVTLKSLKKLGISDEIAEFIAPFGAAIILSGSTISIVICSYTVLALDGISLSFSQIIGFILMLGITMVAAPGVPGGAIMAALGLLESMLGFNEVQLGLMMALYIAQDSFGTATNVIGDGAIALIVDKIFKRPLKSNNANVLAKKSRVTT